MSELSKRCEEPLANLLASTGLDVSELTGVTTSFLSGALDKMLTTCAQRMGIQPSLCRMLVALLVDDSVQLQAEAREFARATNVNAPIDQASARACLAREGA